MSISVCMFSVSEEKECFECSAEPGISKTQGNLFEDKISDILYVVCFQCHSNETLNSLRQKIISGLNQTQEYIQIHANDKLVSGTRMMGRCCLYENIMHEF